MNKIEMNNQMVLMRKNVTQARLHIISKLSRTASKLRKKKENEEIKPKNKRKADRLVAEILSIKKVHPDKITEFALTNEQKLDEILNKVESQPMDRAMARIAHHKVFSKKIEEFKTKYPNFKEYLEFKKNNSKKSKKDKKNKETKSKTKKDNKVVDRCSDDESRNQVNADEINENSEDEKLEPSTGGKKSKFTKKAKDSNKKLDVLKPVSKEAVVKKLTDILQEDEHNIDKNDDQIKMSSDESSEEKESEDEDSFDENDDQTMISSDENIEEKKPEPKEDIKKSKTSKKTNSSKKNLGILKPVSKEAVIKRFTDVLQEDEHIYDSENPATETVHLEKTEDPFFVTADGNQSYLCIAPVVKESSKMSDDEDENQDHYRTEDNYSQVPKFSKNFKVGKNDQKNKRRNEKSFSNNHRDSFDKQPKRGNKAAKPFNLNNKNPSKEEVLHPSWEAKRKQQEALKKGFQGKKIVFGDD